MSRYIDADNAIERLGAYLMADAQIEYGGLASEDIDDWKPIAIDILKGAPSIDIVRCKECRHWDNTDNAERCSHEYGGMWAKPDDFCSYGSRSEKPNNCEYITEDGVTCAKYPACDDCLDNPLNKLKGSERLVKGLEQTDCQTCKWWSSYGYCVHRECKGYEPQTERSSE